MPKMDDQGLAEARRRAFAVIELVEVYQTFAKQTFEMPNFVQNVRRASELAIYRELDLAAAAWDAARTEAEAALANYRKNLLPNFDGTVPTATPEEAKQAIKKLFDTMDLLACYVMAGIEETIETTNTQLIITFGKYGQPGECMLLLNPLQATVDAALLRAIGGINPDADPKVLLTQEVTGEECRADQEEVHRLAHVIDVHNIGNDAPADRSAAAEPWRLAALFNSMKLHAEASRQYKRAIKVLQALLPTV